MASKSKSRRRVFRASCILAALIVAGSSFAWFTSKDEVTNRLSASGDYDVTIAEDFTPPENWLPGQKVDKNVGAVNTGTIDAFVRMWLEGEMNVLNEKRDTQKWDTTNNKFTAGTGKDTLFISDVYTEATGAIAHDGTSTLTKETDQDLIDKNLTYYYMDNTEKDSKISLKELDKTNLYNNPNSPITEVSSPDGYTEVMALQAGGELVYVKTTEGKFEFTFKPNQTQNIVSAGYGSGENAVGGTRYDILGGTEYTVKVGTALATGDDIKVTNDSATPTYEIEVKDLATFYKYIGDNIDTNTFEPKTTGLYIFKRNTEMNDNKYEDSEYTGYYYVAKDGTDTGADGKFFALQYENDGSTRSNYVLDKDTYTIIRDNTGKETFVPSNSTATSDGKTFYKIGSDYYDANGFELVDTAAADEDYDKAAAITTWSNEKTVTLYTAKKDVIKNKELTWKYDDQNEGVNPIAGSTIKYNGTDYTYNDSDRWSYVSGENITVDVGDALNTEITDAYKKANAAIEVEDNGKVYTYKDGAAGAGWYAAGSNAKEDADSEARLNAAINKHATLTATYYGAENDAMIKGTMTTDPNPSDNISVVVNLNNINKDVAEAWTRIIDADTRSATAGTPAGGGAEAVDGISDNWGYISSEQNTFYYNNDVEEGASTKKLVDSVELSKDTQKNAYLGFDFDLNVNMESMQITVADNGVESGENIKPWSSTTNAVTATGTVANADANNTTEISSIAWA